VLKPGGIFGVIEHRSTDGVTREASASIHRIPAPITIADITSVEFVLDVESDIHANHPEDDITDSWGRGKTSHEMANRIIHRYRKHEEKYSVYVIAPKIIMLSGLVFVKDVHWAYFGNTGPEHWGELDPAFSACSVGKNQPSIDISGVVDGDLPGLKVNHESDSNEILNGGHTIQMNYQADSNITVDSRVLELKQFHFHSSSENTIEGKPYPMEAHFVHADEEGNLAVIAVIFQRGEENISLRDACAQMLEKNKP